MAFMYLFTVLWFLAKTCKINLMVHYVLCLLRSEAEILIIFTPEREISRGIKKKKRFVGSLDQFQRLEVCKKVRNVFVMSLRLSDH